MCDFYKACHVDDLVPNSGVAVLINDQQIALFNLANEVYATSNYDPVGKANVMSRGMVGDLKGEPMVAAPLYKEHYSLITGQCLDNDALSIAVFEVKIEQGTVFIKV